MKNFTKYLGIIAIVFVMICAFLISRHKSQINEAINLPYNELNIENIKDGTYFGKTYTSFLHLQLEIIIFKGKINKINIIENTGLKGKKASKIIEQMILQNKIKVPVIKGAELESLVFISCVNQALK